MRRQWTSSEPGPKGSARAALLCGLTAKRCRQLLAQLGPKAKAAAAPLERAAVDPGGVLVAARVDLAGAAQAVPGMMRQPAMTVRAMMARKPVSTSSSRTVETVP